MRRSLPSLPCTSSQLATRKTSAFLPLNLFSVDLYVLNVFQNGSELCIRIDVAAVHTSLPIRRCCVIVVKYVERVVKRGEDLFGGFTLKIRRNVVLVRISQHSEPFKPVLYRRLSTFSTWRLSELYRQFSLHALSERTTGCLLQSNLKLTKTID